MACLIYGVLALGSGLDRMSRDRPALAPHIPSPFASQALRVQAQQALDAGDLGGALVLGAAAVADAPVDPESAALLGLARLKAGDRAGTDQAYQVAGRLGWRVPAVQAYWMDRALSAGDHRVAAMRLNALLRQQPSLAADRRLIDPLEQSAKGRAALARQIQSRPEWLGAYTSAAARLPRDALLRRAQVMDAAARGKVVAGCDRIAPLVEGLLAARAIAEARLLWHQHCPGAAGGLIHDAQFATATLDQDRSQFAWTFIGQSDVGTLFELGANTAARRLLIRSEAQVSRLLVRQLVVLEPGTYRLAWRATDGTGQPSDLVVAALSCSADPQDWLAAHLDPGSRHWVAEVTVDRACPARWLGFGIKGPGEAALGDTVLTRL